MKASILQAPHRFVITEMPRPVPGPHEALIRVRACGICTSEVDQWEGKALGLDYPRFIGHEVGGIIEEIGSEVTAVRPGDHVVLFAEGKGYAEYITLAEERIVKLKPDTAFDLALGEPIACSVNGVRKLDVQLNDSVCLVGCGFMGLIMLQVLRMRTGGALIAVDPRDSMLDLARALGATHAINPGTTDVKQAVMDITGGRGVDCGIEAAGSQRTLDLAGELVRMEGKLEVFGFHQGPPRQVPWGYWNWMAFQIVNGHSRSASVYVEGMRQGIALLEAGRLDMKPLVTHRFALEQLNEGFEAAISKPPGFVKGVVTFEE